MSRRFDLSSPTFLAQFVCPPKFRGGGQGGCAGREGYVSKCTHGGSSNGGNPLCSRTGTVPGGVLAPSQHGRSTQDTAPVLQGSDKVGKLGGRIWDLGGRPMYRRRSLPGPLSRARVGVRLQPAPAAASPGQPYYPDSSRLVCRSRGGPMRDGTPPSYHVRGGGIRLFWH